MKNHGPIVEGAAGNLGELDVHKGLRSKLGICNFCPTSSIHTHVYQISGQGTQIRICKRHLNIIKQKTKE